MICGTSTQTADLGWDPPCFLLLMICFTPSDDGVKQIIRTNAPCALPACVVYGGYSHAPAYGCRGQGFAIWGRCYPHRVYLVWGWGLV